MLLNRSLRLQPRNAHAVHGRVHAWVELGDSTSGAAFLEAWLPDYYRASQLHGHLNWHLALFELDLDAADRAFKRYLDHINPGATTSPPMPALADAASFLWRCMLYRKGSHPLPWQAAADLERQSFPGAGLAFADLHAAMAAAATADRASVERRATECEQLVAEGCMPQGPSSPISAVPWARTRRGTTARRSR